MKYIVDVIVRTITVALGLFILFGLPYFIFWRLPIAVGTYAQKNQVSPEYCYTHGFTFCQWMDGTLFLIIGLISLIIVITIITFIIFTLKFIFFGEE